MGPGLRLVVEPDLELRPLDERDVGALFALTDANRAALREWLPWLDGVRSPEDTRAFVATAQRRLGQREGLDAGIRAAGTLIGVISYHRISWSHRSTEIGYWLGAAWQGRGLMTRACRALTAHALRELGLNRVEIRCATGNRKSRAIPERLGFAREGTLRQAEWLHDHFVDLVVYGMLAREWLAAGDARGT
jgi:ribosomal-protein-serine acetyltransferase